MRTLAVVVTHNRCELLSRCLDYLTSQTRPPTAIVVINNASTDGTVEMLKRRDIAFITQENLGSAGGWQRGIQYGIDHDFDAVWLMDDDGFPSKNALQTLEDSLTPEVACASSVVVREDCSTHFVFPFPVLDKAGLPVIFSFERKKATLAKLSEIAQADTYPFVHLFNGALVSTTAIRKIGNVDRDFFMFGDEVDYFFRLRRAGKVFSVLKALHYHPDVSQRPYTPAKVYYYVKNTLVLNARYFNAVWLRHALTIGVVLARTASRNGLRAALSYLIGSNAAVFRRAISQGLRGKIGKDFNG